MNTQDYEVIRRNDTKETDCVGLDDIVDINGIVGYLDFIGQDAIVIVDKGNRSHKIAIKEIRSVVKIRGWIKGNMTNVPIKSLIGNTNK